jgi:hypothetical protein
MSITTIAHTNGNGSTPKSQSWLHHSVQKFFSGINWEDQPPEVQEIKLNIMEAAAQGQPTTLSLQLSVSQFFSAIAWDGTPVAAAPNNFLTPEASTANSFTLEDFTDLF